MKVSNNTDKVAENSKVKYNLAKTTPRILAAITDYLLIFFICLGLAALLFLTDKNFHGDLNFVIGESYRYFLFGILVITIFFNYFITLPYIWKGQTLGLKLFKLGIHNLVFTKFFLNLLKRAIFSWGLIVTFAFIVSLILFIVGINDPQKANLLITQIMTHDKNKEFYQIGVFLSCIYVVFVFVLIIIIFSICLNSGKQALHDKFSNTVTVKLVDANSSKEQANLNEKKKIKTRNYSLPGGVLDSSVDEIDSI